MSPATALQWVTAGGYLALFGACLWAGRRAGRITGLGVAVNDPRTAGTATLEIWLAGSATGVTAVLDDTSTTGAWEVADVSFEVGELIELYLTTSGWTPTGADIQAMLEVVWS